MSLVFVRPVAFIGLLCSFVVMFLYTSKKSVFHKVVCVNNSCQKLLYTRYSRLFGVPNFVLGGIYYGVLLFMPKGFVPVMKIVSIIAVLVSVYLSIMLVRLKANCIPCWLGNSCNLVIMILIFL